MQAASATSSIGAANELPVAVDSELAAPLPPAVVSDARAGEKHKRTIDEPTENNNQHGKEGTDETTRPIKVSRTQPSPSSVQPPLVPASVALTNGAAAEEQQMPVDSQVEGSSLVDSSSATAAAVLDVSTTSAVAGEASGAPSVASMEAMLDANEAAADDMERRLAEIVNDEK